MNDVRMGPSEHWGFIERRGNRRSLYSVLGRPELKQFQVRFVNFNARCPRVYVSTYQLNAGNGLRSSSSTLIGPGSMARRHSNFIGRDRSIARRY